VGSLVDLRYARWANQVTRRERTTRGCALRWIGKVSYVVAGSVLVMLLACAMRSDRSLDSALGCVASRSIWIDLRAGRVKAEWEALCIPVWRDVTATWITRESRLGANVKPDWRLVSHKLLWFGNSPSFAYSSTLGQIHNLEIALELYVVPESVRRRIATALLEQWKTERPFSGASAFVRATLVELDHTYGAAESRP
jgi:hypothetical protein